MNNIFYTKLAVFLTAFGSAFTLKLFKEYGSLYFLALGALVILAGFTYLIRFAKKAA
ncbi:MAG TPA: hypothetical protein VJG85_00610 [Patescibacteria group bacterium]|nr:hypothetical protein [Patescibacteria group bacterium]